MCVRLCKGAAVLSHSGRAEFSALCLSAAPASSRVCRAVLTRLAISSTTHRFTAPASLKVRHVASASTAAPASRTYNASALRNSMDGDGRIADLRRAMAAADGGKGVDAYIVPSEDPHMSEYAPQLYERRQFISHFTGSAGTAVITTDAALLWTDGRYFLQAEQELGKEWTLMKSGTKGVLEIEDWLATNIVEGGRVGIDPFVHTVDAARRLINKLQDTGRVLVPLLEDGNLVDKAWGSARPAAPAAPLRVHPMRWAGESVATKLGKLHEALQTNKADMLLVTSLDEVAWLFNLRGSDVSYNPVFLAYATISADGTAALYIDNTKVSASPVEVATQLHEAGIKIRQYDQMIPDIRSAAAAGLSLLLDPAKVSYAIYQAAKEAAAAAVASAAMGGVVGQKRSRTDEPPAVNGAPAPAATATPRGRLVEGASPVVLAKAVKNTAELEGMREAHLRDAVAICEFMSSFEQQVASGKVLTEVDVDLQLTARRAAQQGFIELSFPTIAGAGPNGAIIHYRPQSGTCAAVGRDTMLLIDSGGQYDCGTTDITRTIHLGTPTEHQRRCFTRVLQGHIALDQAVFPESTPGPALDVLARVPLWRDGLNYRHGTGHGVGAALNVHEGPQSISQRYHMTAPLQSGMVVSNEPGFYSDGEFGVRIENLVTVIPVETPCRFASLQYYGFERLTQVPIQAKMMDLSIMSPQEITWVDLYHTHVKAAVSPRLQHDSDALAWLERSTQPLGLVEAAQ